jgi:hypothetical protein
MAKRPLRALDAFLTRCRTVPENIASLSYDPSTGAASVSFFKPAAAVQPEAEQEPEQPEEPMDFRFALERFNDSPKPRQKQ